MVVTIQLCFLERSSSDGLVKETAGVMEIVFANEPPSHEWRHKRVKQVCRGIERRIGNLSKILRNGLAQFNGFHPEKGAVQSGAGDAPAEFIVELGNEPSGQRSFKFPILTVLPKDNIGVQGNEGFGLIQAKVFQPDMMNGGRNVRFPFPLDFLPLFVHFGQGELRQGVVAKGDSGVGKSKTDAVKHHRGCREKVFETAGAEQEDVHTSVKSNAALVTALPFFHVSRLANKQNLPVTVAP